MGIFDSFSKGFNQGRECARDEAYREKQPKNFPIELVEPSTGRIVELQVTEQDEFVAKLYMDILITYAEALEQFDVQWKTTGKTIRLMFVNGDMAENARQTWKK